MAEYEELRNHLRQGRKIVDDFNLYTIWESIPKSNDPDFTNNSFSELVRQGLHFRNYDEWTAKLEGIFLENKLDYLKFKSVTSTYDGRKSLNQPAAVFVRKVKELERMFESPNILESYITLEKQVANWPPVTFKDGIVAQGNRSHKFSQELYVQLINELWGNRRIESVSGVEIEAGVPTTRETLNRNIGLSSHGRFTSTVTGIRKAMKAKHIELHILYPSDVILVVRQTK